jgi:WD40 repeat protein
MARIFISHSSRNNVNAIALNQWLGENGWDDVFLDLDPEQGIAPGQHWQMELKKAANRCEAVIFLVSRAWLDSRWCLAEFILATNLNKKIFGVLLEPIDLDLLPTEMSSEWQLCDLSPQQSDGHVDPDGPMFNTSGLARLKAGLERAGLDARTFPWPPPDEPSRFFYRGLEALEEKDAAVFFGRSGEIISSLDQLRKLRHQSYRGLLVIIGASGAGKSSLLKAGILPRLHRDDRNFLVCPTVRPLENVLTGTSGLARALESKARELGLSLTLAAIEAAMEDAKSLGALLWRLHEQARATIVIGETTSPRQLTVVLPIDQAEELFQDTRNPEMQRFLTMLASLTSTDTSFQFIPILTIRSDRYERLQRSEQLTAVSFTLIDLSPMEPAHFKDVITGPLYRAHEGGERISIEPALVDELLRDSTGAAALPILSFTLEQLYRRYRAAGTLRLSDYRELKERQGGVISAVVKEALAQPHHHPAIPDSSAHQEEQLRSLFTDYLISVDIDSGEPRRRRCSFNELDIELEPIAQRLIEARLLVQGKVSGDNDLSIEIAHDSLLNTWPPLMQWLAHDRELLLLRERVERFMRQSRSDGSKESAAALPDALLRRAMESLDTDPQRMAPVSGFLRACHKQSRRVRWLRRGLVGALLVSLIAIIAVIPFTNWLSGQVERLEAAMLALESRELLSDSPVTEYDIANRAALLAIESVRHEQSFEGWAALTAAMQALPPHHRLNHVDYNDPNTSHLTTQDTLVSAAGDLMITSMSDDTLKFWDGDSIELLESIDYTGGVYSLALSDSADYLISVEDTMIYARSLRRQGGTLTINEAELIASCEEGVAVSQPQISTDASTVAVICGHSQLLVAKHCLANQNSLVESCNVWRTTEYLDSEIEAVATAGNGSLVAAATQRGTIYVIEVGSNIVHQFQHPEPLSSEQPLSELQRFSDLMVKAIAFSPDSRMLATGGWDGSVRVWDLQNIGSGGIGGLHSNDCVDHCRQALYEFRYGAYVNDLAFSANGKRLAAGGLADDVAVWNLVRANSPPHRFPYTKNVDSLKFSENGRFLLIHGKGGAAQIWGTKTRELIRSIPPQYAIAASADLRQLVTKENGFMAWRPFQGNAWRTLLYKGTPLDGYQIIAHGLSQDGRIYAALTYHEGGHTVLAWDTESEQLVGVPQAVPLYPNITGSWYSPKQLSVFHGPEGLKVAVASGNHVEIYSIDPSAASTETSQVFAGNISSIDFVNGDDSLLVISHSGYRGEKMAELWDYKVKDAEGVKALLPDYKISDVVVGSDGAKALAIAGEELLLWNLQSGKIQRSYPIVDDTVIRLTISDDNRVGVALTEEGALVRIDLVTGEKRTRELSLRKYFSTPTTISDKYELAVAPTGDTVILSDRDIVISPNADSSELRIPSDTRNGPEEVHFLGNSAILTREDDDTNEFKVVSLKNYKDSVAIRSNFSRSLSPGALALPGEQAFILPSSGTGLGPVLWAVDFSSLSSRLCQSLTRNLSCEEWHMYMGNRPYQKTCPSLPAPTSEEDSCVDSRDNLASEFWLNTRRSAQFLVRRLNGEVHSHMLLNTPKSEPPK